MTFAVREGLAVGWTIGQETDPEKLREGFARIASKAKEALANNPTSVWAIASLPAIEKLAGKNRTHLASLRAAMAETYCQSEELVRPLRRRQNYGYTLVHEDKCGDHGGGVENDYRTELTIRIDKDDKLVALKGNPDLVALTSLSDHFRKTLPSESVNKVLANVCGLFDSVTRANGDHFIHNLKILPIWLEIIEVVEGAATRGCKNRLRYDQFKINSTTVTEVEARLEEDLAKELKEMEEEFLENKVGERAVNNRADRVVDRFNQIKKVGESLGASLDGCRKAIATMAKLVTKTKSIQEEEKAKGGLIGGTPQKAANQDPYSSLL